MPERLTRSAMWRTTVAEQFTVEQSAMKLRVPTRAVGAAEALEGRAHRVAVADRPVVDADLVILVVLAHGAIVHVHVRAGAGCRRWRSR